MSDELVISRSERTKAALAAAKARGVQLGNPRFLEIRNTDTSKAVAAKIANALVFKTVMQSVIEGIEQDAGDRLTSTELARRLNKIGYKTRRGYDWTHTQVLRVKK